MGAPSSAILPNVFLQYIETSHIATLAKNYLFREYFPYVEDILLIFDSTPSNTQSILTYFNSIHPNLHFTAETESNNITNCLDISVRKTEHNIRLQISNFRKPTFTDTIIPYTSNHPAQHKFTAIRYLHNRLYAYQLNNVTYNHALNTIQNIL